MEEAKRNTVLPAWHGLHKKNIIETERKYKKEMRKA
jgi:hypothetical protein